MGPLSLSYRPQSSNLLSIHTPIHLGQCGLPLLAEALQGQEELFSPPPPSLAGRPLTGDARVQALHEKGCLTSEVCPP